MTELNKELAKAIAKKHIANTIEIHDISNIPPADAYCPSPSNDFWYVTCSAFELLGTGPRRVICISKKTGDVISDQLVGE